MKFGSIQYVTVSVLKKYNLEFFLIAKACFLLVVCVAFRLARTTKSYWDRLLLDPCYVRSWIKMFQDWPTRSCHFFSFSVFLLLSLKFHLPILFLGLNSYWILFSNSFINIWLDFELVFITCFYLLSIRLLQSQANITIFDWCLIL